MSKLLTDLTNAAIEKHEKGHETYVVVRDVIGATPYWATDVSLPKVRSRFKRLTGKYPSKEASIVAFTGEVEELDQIAVDDMGDIHYPKSLSKAVLQ